jgi:hypothetical protein
VPPGQDWALHTVIQRVAWQIAWQSEVGINIIQLHLAASWHPEPVITSCMCRFSPLCPEASVPTHRRAPTLWEQWCLSCLWVMPAASHAVLDTLQTCVQLLDGSPGHRGSEVHGGWGSGCQLVCCMSLLVGYEPPEGRTRTYPPPVSAQFTAGLPSRCH